MTLELTICFLNSWKLIAFDWQIIFDNYIDALLIVSSFSIRKGIIISKHPHLPITYMLKQIALVLSVLYLQCRIQNLIVSSAFNSKRLSFEINTFSYGVSFLNFQASSQEKISSFEKYHSVYQRWKHMASSWSIKNRCLINKIAVMKGIHKIRKILCSKLNVRNTLLD